MVKKLNPIKVARILKNKEIFIFSPLDFQRIFDVSIGATQKFLTRNSRKDFLIKLRAGLYAVADNFPSPYLIANELYKPSYISLERALSFHHIIPETIYTVTSVSSKATREFQVEGILYTYQKIKKEVFCGYCPEQIDNQTVLIAEPEKALVDYLYFIDLQKREPNDRLELKELSKRKVLDYAKLFKRKGLNKLIDAVYDFSTKHREVY